MTCPMELIQQIYLYLHPKDFNAARHTCRSWMTASLDRSLLVLMLTRAGWSNNIDGHTWSLSCRLSRECALSSEWTGNGVSASDKISSFQQTAWIDFTELGSGHAGPSGRSTGGIAFTVSVCGNYLLVTKGVIIYVYELFADNIRVLTSIVCPRRVLAMSMDASSKRFVVVALLDGRMGLMCELQFNHKKESAETSAIFAGAIIESTTKHRESLRNSLFTACLYPGDDRLSLPQIGNLPHRRKYPSRSSNFFNTEDISNPYTIELTAPDHIILEDTTSLSGRFTDFIDQSWSLQLSNITPPFCRPSTTIGTRPPVLIETGPRSLYRHICSDDDPPRSVAICPRRQCVAFGCSAGLELHWVDALTGQDLNRWFPLTGPSDFLYFLPPRQGIDSPCKLRLISSATHPSQRSALARRFHTATNIESTLIPFWRTIGYDTPTPMPSALRDHISPPVFAASSSRVGARTAPLVSNCDHYRAIPLSDGFHILFTDPESNMLCLGSDAPLGDSRRLLRKLMFVPPSDDAIPRIYAAGKEVTGSRIVAVYDDTLMLYSVPADVFIVSGGEQKIIGPKSAGIVDYNVDTAMPWLSWWPSEDIPANYPRLFPSPSDIILAGPISIWPLFVRGTIIGTLKGLVDIAVNEVDGLAIWGFALDGRAKVWQVDNGRHGSVHERVVERDGYVVDVEIEVEGGRT